MTVNQHPNPWLDSLQAWRHAEEAELRADDGWLTVIGLFWLDEGDNPVGSSPDAVVALPDRLPAHAGTLTRSGETVTWRAADGVDARVDGQPARFASLSADPFKPTRVQIAEITFFLIRRGDRIAARVRDTASDARRAFTGRVWFPADPALRVRGQFIPHPNQRMIEVETVIGSTAQFSNPGVVTFELDGAPQRLEAFEGEPGELWFLFRDGTSGHETYAAGRELYAALNADRSVDLDFNKAENPPCVFTPYATCPLPPKENDLPVAVRAGEQMPEGH